MMTTKMSNLKAMFNAERAKARAISMEHGVGYGIGYTVTTVKEEAKGIGRAIADTKAGVAVKEATINIRDGYYEGCNDAYASYVQRAIKREEKKRIKDDQKRLNDAVNEMAEAIK